MNTSGLFRDAEATEALRNMEVMSDPSFENRFS